MSEHVLISPLGLSPGAASGVYFALQAQGIPIARVITVGTRDTRVQSAGGTLIQLFRREPDVAYKPCYIYQEELDQAASGPFAARMGLYIDKARQAGQTVHVAVTGGRSGMGALAALAAQIYRADRLYHLWVREDIEREGANPNQPAERSNLYLNPTVAGRDAWNLVKLPFADLSDWYEDAQKYRASGQFPENWTAARLVTEGPAMLEALAAYVPAGLTIQQARELLDIVSEWREEVEWVAPDDPSQKIHHGKIDLAAQKALWERALAILYSAGAVDETTLQDLRELWKDSISDDYVQRRLNHVAEHDDTELLFELRKKKQELTLAWVNAGVDVATLILLIISTFKLVA